jgi:hypothetical protein
VYQALFQHLLPVLKLWFYQPFTPPIFNILIL